MIGTALEVEPGSTLETDLCIIGTGPAGLAIARHFEGRGRSVLLLESGGLEPNAAIQGLYAGANLGRPYFTLDGCRMRYLGGSSNCWAGLCRPLDPEDFEARPWIPESGWPLTRADLDPFYVEAETFLGLVGQGWDQAHWSAGAHKDWPFSDSRVESGFFKLSAPVRLGTTLRPLLQGSQNLRVVLGASVTGLGLAPDGTRLDHLKVARSKGGGGFTVRPRTTVLACGGIENARILLASNDVHPAGVGNGHDRVGRYFMEHPHTDGEGLVLGAPGLPRASFYRRHVVHGQAIWGCLTLSGAVRAREGLLSAAVVLVDSSGSRDPLVESLRRTIADTDSPGQQLPEKPELFTFGTPSEQCPDPESRVLLDGERDPLGMPRSRLNWRLSPFDQRSVARTHEIIAEAFARSGLGRVKLTLKPGRPFADHVLGGRHHMGTTRMHTDPRRGVVDAHQRVHGIANLYVAGSSVFPTSGSANPTLTLTALSLRLAAHLERTP